MRKLICASILLCVSLHAQIIGGRNRKIFSGGGGSSVSVTSHIASGSACTNASLPWSCSYGTVTAATGDTIVASFQFCWDGTCTNVPTGCVIAVSDAGGSYTDIPASDSGVGAVWAMRNYYRANVASGTYTVTYSISAGGAGCPTASINYAVTSVVVFHGANTSTPVDTAVSNWADGTTSGTTGSLTSAGNVTGSGEAALCLVTTTSTGIGFTGAFSVLDTGGSGGWVTAKAIGPTSGATTTCSFNNTASATAYHASILAIKP